MNITTNAHSKAYSYCWAEGVTVTAVIDVTDTKRTVRIQVDAERHDALETEVVLTTGSQAPLAARP